MGEQPQTPGSGFAKRHVSGMLKHLEGEEQRTKAQEMTAAYSRMFADKKWGAVIAGIQRVVDEDHLRVKDEQDPASSTTVAEDHPATPPAHPISLPSSESSRLRTSAREKWDVPSAGPATPLSPTPLGNAFAVGGFWEDLTSKTPLPDTPTTAGAPLPPYSPIIPHDRQGRKAYKRAKDQVDAMALTVCAKRWSAYVEIKDHNDVPRSLVSMQDCLVGATVALEYSQVNLDTAIDPKLPKLLEGLAHEEKKISDKYSIRDASALVDLDTWLQVDPLSLEFYTLYDAQRELFQIHCNRRKSEALRISAQAINQAWTTRIVEDAERIYEATEDDSSDESGYAQNNFLGSIRDAANSSSDLDSMSDYQSRSNSTSMYSSSSLQLSRETTFESQRSSSSQPRSPYVPSARSSTSPTKPSFAHQLRTRENSLSHSPSPEKVAQSQVDHINYLRSRKSSLSHSQTSSPGTPSHAQHLRSKKSSLSQYSIPNNLRKLPPPAQDHSVPSSPSLERLRKTQPPSQADLVTSESSPETLSFGEALKVKNSSYSIAADLEKLRRQPKTSQKSAESEDAIPEMPPFPHRLLSKKSGSSQNTSSETLRKFPVPSRESSPFNDPDPEQSSHAQQLRTQTSNLSLVSTPQTLTLEEFLASPRENESVQEQPPQGPPLRSKPSDLFSDDRLRRNHTHPREQDVPRTAVLENPSHAHQLRAQASKRRLELQHFQSRPPDSFSPVPSPEDSPYAHGRLSPRSDVAYATKQMRRILAQGPHTVLTDTNDFTKHLRPSNIASNTEQLFESPKDSPEVPRRPPPLPPQTSAPDASRAAKRSFHNRIITYDDQPIESPRLSPEERRSRRMAASQTDLSAWAGELKNMEARASAQQMLHKVVSREAVIDHVRPDSMESIRQFALETLGRAPRPQQEQQFVSDLPFRSTDRLRQDALESINNSTQQQEPTSDLPFRRSDRPMRNVDIAPPPQQQQSDLQSRRHDRFRTDSMETHHDSPSQQRQPIVDNPLPRYVEYPRPLAGNSDARPPQHQRFIGNPPPRRTDRHNLLSQQQQHIIGNPPPRRHPPDSKYSGRPHASDADRPGPDAALLVDNINDSPSTQQQQTLGDFIHRRSETNRQDTMVEDSIYGPAPELPLRSPARLLQGPQDNIHTPPPPRHRAPSDHGLRRRNAGRIAPSRHPVHSPITPSSATLTDLPMRQPNFSTPNTPEAVAWPVDDSPRYAQTPRRQPAPLPGSSVASPRGPGSVRLSVQIRNTIGAVREGIQRIEEYDYQEEVRRLEREERHEQWERENPDWDK